MICPSGCCAPRPRLPQYVSRTVVASVPACSKSVIIGPLLFEKIIYPNGPWCLHPPRGRSRPGDASRYAASALTLTIRRSTRTFDLGWPRARDLPISRVPGSRVSGTGRVPRAAASRALSAWIRRRARRLDAVAQAELGQDPADVNLHGALGQEQAGRDLAVGHARRDAGEDVLLRPVRACRTWAAGRLLGGSDMRSGERLAAKWRTRRVVAVGARTASPAAMVWIAATRLPGWVSLSRKPLALAPARRRRNRQGRRWSGSAPCTAARRPRCRGSPRCRHGRASGRP